MCVYSQCPATCTSQPDILQLLLVSEWASKQRQETRAFRRAICFSKEQLPIRAAAPIVKSWPTSNSSSRAWGIIFEWLAMFICQLYISQCCCRCLKEYATGNIILVQADAAKRMLATFRWQWRQQPDKKNWLAHTIIIEILFRLSDEKWAPIYQSKLVEKSVYL